MNNPPVPRSPILTGRRLGFHYYPDTFHYRDTDLNTWVPRLQGLGAAWLVLMSETGRAIPEAFVRGLLEAGIEPVIHFQRGLESAFDPREIRPLIEAYARWGARYVIFYDRPNARSAWPTRGWVQQDLARNFLDRYLPAANLAVQHGLVTIFPPLEPGGSYWDTAFLRSCLQGLVDRQEMDVARSLALAAYAWADGRSLNWGAGGPERWPQSRPYHTPTGSQDQRGFRIFDWYQAVAQDVLGRSLPVFLLQAGAPQDPRSAAQGGEDEADYAQTCSDISRLMGGETVTGCAEEGQEQHPVAPQVAAACFWLLAAQPGSREAAQAWFRPTPGEPESAGLFEERAACAALRTWAAQQERLPAAKSGPAAGGDDGHPLNHYLLLPGFEWGVSDWYFELAHAFIKKFRPVIGFSVEEARLAARVTVVGQVPGFTREALDTLTQAGCEVDWIDGDGTTIATRLAER